MRIESSVTALSWIPQEAVEGAPRTLFDIGLDAYDAPPPEVLTDIDRLQRDGGFRTANVLRAWIDVEGGRITGFGQDGSGLICSSVLRVGPSSLAFPPIAFPDIVRDPEVGSDTVTFFQTTGGSTGLPAPRRVNRPPFVQIAAPPCWTSLALTISADGSSSYDLTGASRFPRHWVYDDAGKVVAKSGLVDFNDWWRGAFGRRTPWGAEDSPALVMLAETDLERRLSAAIMGADPQIRTVEPGSVLVEQDETGSDIFLLLDGLLTVDRDGEAVAQLGPGAIVGERALFEGGRRTASLRAATRCRVAVVAPHVTDIAALASVASARGSTHASGEAGVDPAGAIHTTTGRLNPHSAHTFEDYFPAYMGMHAHPVNRWLHFAGWHLAALVAMRALVLRRPRGVLAAFVTLVGPPVTGHLVFERTASPTGRNLWEFRADFRMMAMLWRGRIAELDDASRRGGSPRFGRRRQEPSALRG